MSLTPRQKLTAVSIGCGIVLGACAWIFWYAASAVTDNDAVRAGIQQKIDGLEQDRVRSQAFSALLARRRDDIGSIGGFFPERNHPVIFLQTLESLGRTTGATIAIDVDDGAGDADHLGFRVTLTGSEQALVLYVRLLERAPYDLAIIEINETRNASDSSAGPGNQMVLTISVRTQQ